MKAYGIVVKGVFGLFVPNIFRALNDATLAGLLSAVIFVNGGKI